MTSNHNYNTLLICSIDFISEVVATSNDSLTCLLLYTAETRNSPRVEEIITPTEMEFCTAIILMVRYTYVSFLIFFEFSDIRLAVQVFGI